MRTSGPAGSKPGQTLRSSATRRHSASTGVCSDDDIEGSLAWADALAAAGVLSAAEAAAICDGLAEIRRRGRDDPAFVDGDDEDVHAFVERQLIERVGDLGRRLHTGRSRNEQVSLDLRLYLRRRIPLLQREVASLIVVLADRAEAAEGAIMPAYTHLRRAQPILVAHFLLAHAAAVPARPRASGRGHRRGGRDAARVGRGRGHELCHRHRGACRAARLLAGRRQQRRRGRGPRLRRGDAACVGARNGAHQPVGGGSDPRDGGGVRLFDLDDRVATGSS